jgi:opacity protein-like surface antigen
MKRTTVTLAAAALAVAAALPAQAQDAQRVVRDSATGQLRAPTPAEGTALAARASRAPVEATKAKYSRRGGAGVRLNNDFLSHSVLQRHADGSVAEQCVAGEDAAASLVNAPVAASRSAAAKVETE